MDNCTAGRLTKLAPQIQKYMELDDSEKEWLIFIVGKAERRAIAILEAIENRFLTYKEIAEIVDCHPNTVKLILYALDNGGIPLQTDRSGRWLTPSTGRNKKLIKSGESENERNNI
jgi:hypothetical protein